MANNMLLFATKRQIRNFIWGKAIASIKFNDNLYRINLILLKG